MYSVRREAMIRTSRGTFDLLLLVIIFEEMILRVGSRPATVSDVFDDGVAAVDGAFISIAAASLCRALGRWTSKHATVQKT